MTFVQDHPKMLFPRRGQELDCHEAEAEYSDPVTTHFDDPTYQYADPSTQYIDFDQQQR